MFYPVFQHMFLVVLLLCVAASAQAAVVLQYHHVNSATPASTSVTPELFQQHMDYLAQQKFTIVPLTELVKALKRGKALPDNSVAITFDDAYESVYSTAYPLLKKRNWPFTIFLNTEPHDQEKKSFATWAQVREMADNGVTIANHSTAHNHLLRLKESESRTQWRKRITAEILDAEKRIKEKTGQSHKMLAYPYGEYDNQVKALVKELGFVAFGQQSGPLFESHDLQSLPRFPFGGSYGDMKDFATKVNTRPLPVKTIEFFKDIKLEQPFQDLVLPPAQRPVLVLGLDDENLLPVINCFASGQGAIAVELRAEQLIVQANKPLPPGRTRYNCTAPTGESGKFYWFSQQWLTTGAEGKWLHED